jgi:hypothetical protein
MKHRMKGDYMPESRPIIAYSNGRPAGAPRRIKLSTRWPLRVGLWSTFVIAAGAMFYPYGLSVQTCRGATRSSRLRFAQVSREIEEAITADDARSADEPNSPDGFDD